MWFTDFLHNSLGEISNNGKLIHEITDASTEKGSTTVGCVFIYILYVCSKNYIVLSSVLELKPFYVPFVTEICSCIHHFVTLF